MTEVSEF